ncbi:MAG: hypothetical protein NTV98_00485 [Candidatus Roizmanbacteria bacterium]|nr:hypothetical protein [Candidatus Roizmanbacteria bacterium]
MKKYAFMGVLFFFSIAICTVSIRSAQAIDTENTVGTSQLRYATINPSEYRRRVTEAAHRKPTLNPTDYILKLSSTPERTVTAMVTRKPTMSQTQYVHEYYLKLSGTPTPTIDQSQYFHKLNGMTEEKPHASPSGVLGKKKLADAKLRICQEKSQDMKKRSIYLVNSVAEIEKKFTSILSGVENYYKEKIVPTGVALPNYDALVADIATREKAVGPLLEKAQVDATNFSCTGDDPHGQLQQLDTDVRAVLHALQEYRTGIHNLMAALRELKVVEPTVTPIPTITILPTVQP